MGIIEVEDTVKDMTLAPGDAEYEEEQEEKLTVLCKLALSLPCEKANLTL